jgi:hypothetical protein
MAATVEKNGGMAPATRRSSRVHFAIPVFVYGGREQGDPFQEMTDTVSVNAGGGLIALATPVKRGQKLLLVNLKSEESIQCSVMDVHGDKSGKLLVGFAFDELSPRYWGLVFPPEDWESADRKRPERQ